MTLIKETGAGVVGANSFLTAAEAITLAANRPGMAAFILVATAELEAFLIQAWQTIEGDVSWYGAPVAVIERNMSWPRTGMQPREKNFTYASAVIPPLVILAQFEMAYQLYADRLLDQATTEITSMSVTGVTTGLKTRDNVGSRRDIIPTIVYNYLRPFGQFRTDEQSFSLARHLWG